ncbi:hypothetical protein ACW7BJ_16135 [Azospirillum argentinense]
MSKTSIGDIAAAGAAYAAHASTWPTTAAEEYASRPRPQIWPWGARWWKPKDPRRDLVRAGALIAAEIERLDRASAPAPREA